MTHEPEGATEVDLFKRPTTAFLHGSSRPLLNWVAYALASRNPGGFIWTDVRLRDEVLDEHDPLARSLVPPDRLHVVVPDQLMRDDLAGNAAVGGFVRTDEPSESIRRVDDFLRLPPPARRAISLLPREGPPTVFVLSNAHHMTPLYPTETLAPTLRAFVESGASLLVTFLGPAKTAARSYDYVIHVRGQSAEAWRDAVLHVEKGEVPPLRTGTNLRLDEYPAVASVLGQAL